MNKELNIFTLRMLRDQYQAEHLDTEAEALDAAIEALEQPTDGDCISRQAAIDAIEKYDFSFPKYMERFVVELRDAMKEDIRNDIAELPSAQPEQHWIPCSETEDLPEHEVLCCDKYGEELIGWLSCEDDQWLCESDGEMMYDPIAWREKPEPWKGES